MAWLCVPQASRAGLAAPERKERLRAGEVSDYQVLILVIMS